MFYDKQNGGTLSVKELASEMKKNRDLLSDMAVLVKTVTGPIEYYLIDSTGTSAKVDTNKYEVYE